MRDLIKEFQPFERGAEGWASSASGFKEGKFIYITKFEKIHIVCPVDQWDDCSSIDLYFAHDFRTDNPHKKETVTDLPMEELNSILDFADLVVSHSNRIHAFGENVWTKIMYQQIGDDLKAKFDDPTNTKYINLIK
jgi:hypothetical protein